MQDRIRRAILKTVIYSDIFDYPLSKGEVWRFLIGEKVGRIAFDNFFAENLPEKVTFKNNFCYLLGREKIVKERIKRKKESQKKIVVAKKIIKLLSYIPTIQFIGISGALSLENSGKHDDIDLFVITSKDNLWLTRLVMIILLLLMGRYRRRNQREVSDKICLNMLIDESALTFPSNRWNLYTAHEIVQLLPVFERSDTHKKFIDANMWVEGFLPNAFSDRGATLHKTLNHTESLFGVFLRCVVRSSLIDNLAKKLQLWSIKKHQTNETVLDSFVAFHPLDYKKKVLRKYKKLLKLYEV